MKIVLWFMIGFLLAYTPPSTLVEREFKPFVQDFEHEFGVTVDEKIMFEENLEPDRSATCFPHNGTIFIRPSIWKRLTPGQKEVLLYHELGHCYLGLEHDNRIVNSMPFIMNEDVLLLTPQFVDRDLLYMNYDSYLRNRTLGQPPIDFWED